MSLATLFTTKCRACGVLGCTRKRLIGDLAGNLDMTLEIHGCKQFYPKGEYQGYKYDVVHHTIRRSLMGDTDYLTSCGDIVSVFDEKQGLTFQTLEVTCPECIKKINKQIDEENKQKTSPTEQPKILLYGDKQVTSLTICVYGEEKKVLSQNCKSIEDVLVVFEKVKDLKREYNNEVTIELNGTHILYTLVQQHYNSQKEVFG